MGFLGGTGSAGARAVHPVNASWLNPAESLLEAFTARYLYRGHRLSKLIMTDPWLASRLDYNRYFARPFDGHWTRADFRFWLNNTPRLIRCKTSDATH